MKFHHELPKVKNKEIKFKLYNVGEDVNFIDQCSD